MKGYDKIREERPMIFKGMNDEEVVTELFERQPCPDSFGLEVYCGKGGCEECTKKSLEADYPMKEGE